MPENRLLEVRGLTVRFGSVVAVKDLSFHLDRGETLAIVGESGSGKSVTALAILRLIEYGSQGVIEAGEILFRRPDGSVVDLVRQPERVLRGIRGDAISMIFQEPLTSLNPVYTVGNQIAETLVLHRGISWDEAMETALEMLRKVRIPDPERRLRTYPHEMSGGMRQRVMIAMALACRPSILIADEPTTALDVTIQAQTLELMRQLQEEFGTAIILITHDMGVVAETADRVVVMCRSEFVEEGPVGRIFAAPQAEYTRLLLDAVPRLGSLADTPYPKPFPLPGAEAPAETAPPSDRPVLEVDGLVKRFPAAGGQVHAVESVSFTLSAGETLAVVGESGSGKSTVANLVMRLTEPTDGAIRLLGTDITGLSHRAMKPHRREMQMVFQDPYASLDPRRTVGDLVGEPMRIHRTESRATVRDRVAELFGLVGLSPDQMRRYPHQFSGGQRQRLCIARALALHPRLIIADEAVSALDVSIQAQIVNLMLDLQSRLGLSYLFISHDMAVVERVSHRVAVMHLGRIVEIGPRREVLANPRHSYTQRLLSAVPVADPAARGRRGRSLAVGDIPSPIHPQGYTPPPVRLRAAGPGHFVAEE
ncbi:ABC transporter ATP-binding protein [Azospirillum sp. RWY-5-1]|uniref:ABC transporter ATP-binding protein n=2 Tax=Azospirillum oleiclasticum TaxID=2735135 RepID=A0ABX2TJM1_9PROT|nr:ABC transporter ATP-binding protein [Azospirillum oleiclasticum]NYZ24339.1 ABC transporter ATP-binding protein [Azospirillum oleiclasticum]